MTREEKIAGAAELIREEMRKRGEHVSTADAVVLSIKLYNYWMASVRISRTWPLIDGRLVIKEMIDVGSTANSDKA